VPRVRTIRIFREWASHSAGAEARSGLARRRPATATLRSECCGFSCRPAPAARSSNRWRAGPEEITILPDDVIVRSGGQRVVRRVQTGHHRLSDTTDVGAAAFLLAVQQAFPGAEVEVLHLADAKASRIALGPKPLQNKKNIEAMLGRIRAGEFPPKASQFTCPTCPAFFVCGPVPVGSFQKKLS
jgi:hypothetical protein